MSEELLPIELELMSLFDRDISPEERTALIEKLQAYPDLLEKYSVYLHIQDIELSPTPPLPNAIRANLLKTAQRHSQRLKWRERISHWFGWVLQPAIAAPAMVCVAFLIGYELLETPIQLEQTLDENVIAQKVRGAEVESEASSAQKQNEVAQEAGKPTEADPESSAADVRNVKSKFGSTSEGRGLSGLGKKSAAKQRMSSVKSTQVDDTQKAVNQLVNDVVMSKKSTKKENVTTPIPRAKRARTRVARAPAELSTQPPSSERLDSYDAVSPAQIVKSDTDSKALKDLTTSAPTKGSLAHRRARSRSASKPTSNRTSMTRNDRRSQSPTAMKVKPSPPRPTALEAATDESSSLVMGHSTTPKRRGALNQESEESTSQFLAKPNRVTPLERRAFQKFVQTLNPQESLDGVNSGRLLRMAGIAMKLEEYPKARQWLMNIIRREDNYKTRATKMLNELRRQLDD